MQIDRPHRSLIHQEHYFAARSCQGRPRIVLHGFFESRVFAPHLIGRDHFVRSKHCTDFGIECVESDRAEFFGNLRVILRRQLGLLGLEKNENGHMILMLLRPGANDFQTGD